MIQGNGGQVYIGIVEDRNDPLKAGRVKVRVVGLHYHDKSILPTDDLPWAMVMQPVNNGTGYTAVGPAEGTTCVVIFNDYPENQYPIIIGILAGVPQGQPVNIDRFEDAPLWRDDITPQGRPLPTNETEASGNQSGGPIVDKNPALSSLTSQSVANTPQTKQIFVSTLIDPSAESIGISGNIFNSLNQIGCTNNVAKNQFESLLITSAGYDNAIKQFTLEASQSGILGSAIVSILGGTASLRAIALNLGFNVNGLQLSISAVTKVDTLQSVIYSAEKAIQDNVVSVISPVLSKIQTNISTVTNDINSLVSFADVSLGTTDSIISFLENPSNIAVVLNGEYCSTTLAASNVGNIALLQNKEVKEITANDFKGVTEGSTPPVHGNYGGPNYGGASPATVTPKATPVPETQIAYQTGSSLALNLNPPAGYNNSQVSANIQFLVASCKKYGLTSKEQQATFLACVGGECSWIPVAEDYQYSSPDTLLKLFPTTFKGNRELAEKYSNWRKGKKGTREDFFNFIYDPANNGRRVGNTKPGDGGKYYGRGFIQLTGRSLYEEFARISGHPIDTNPDLMVSNPEISAAVSVLYFMKKVNRKASPTAHPGYLLAALDAVGGAADIKERKKKFYAHFYGTATPSSYNATEKIAGNTEPPHTFNGVLTSITDTDTGFGFRDPHSKYPLKRLQYEPQTSRLARGIIKDSIVLKKQSERVLGVPIAMDGDYWDQPQVPFGAKYPYNHVKETESGHVQEFDDTPGYERIQTYHRSGTFEEIDVNGTKVIRIVGDSYEIIDSNGFIYVKGDANITTEGNINILCRSDANIEVSGSAEMKVGGSLDIGVAKDMNVAVEGNFSVWANGNINLQARQKGHIRTNSTLYMSSNEELNIQANSGLYLETISGSTNIKSASLVNLTSAANTNFLIGSTLNIKSTAEINMDGSTINENCGSAASVEATASTKAVVYGMVPPAIGTPIHPRIERKVGPNLHGEEAYMFEGTNAGSSYASQKYIAQLQQNEGISNTYQSESAVASGGSGSGATPSNQNEILAAGTFNANYKLSTNFTLGMLFDGGFNVKHKLIPQCGLSINQIVANLSALCNNILEKCLDILPGGIEGYNRQWTISSGYRMEGVVAASSKTSDHSTGRACDITLLGLGNSSRKQKLHELIKKLDTAVPYDQLILEYAGADSVWIHTGFRGTSAGQTFGVGAGNNRKMAFTMKDHSTYGQGFILLS